MSTRFLLLSIAFSFFAFGIRGQGRWLVGTGITYCSYVDNPGLNLNVTYRVIGGLHIGPDVSALLTKETLQDGRRTRRKELEYNFNAQYVIGLNNRFAVYPLFGVNFSKVTNHKDGKEPEKQLVTALNVGGGVEIELGELKVFAESKWVSKFDKYDVTAGALFKL